MTSFKVLTSRHVSVNRGDAEMVRMEADAEQILGVILRRQRWIAADRDRLAVYLRDMVHREIAKQITGER